MYIRVCTKTKTWNSTPIFPTPSKGHWKHVLSTLLVIDEDINLGINVFGLAKEKYYSLVWQITLVFYWLFIVHDLSVFFSCTMHARSCSIANFIDSWPRIPLSLSVWSRGNLHISFNAYDVSLSDYACFIQKYRHFSNIHKIIVKFSLKLWSKSVW